jgi:Ni/Fe-hydrogenase subunit HybB-like protein
MITRAAPLGGRIATRPFLLLVGFAGLAVLLLAWRFAAGLGAATNMNDGYPWGIWIAWDVVVGTALSTGGYAMALLVYVMNHGRYHPLVRSALVTSALGYTMAGLSVAIDLGRWWNLWRIPLAPFRWNHQSVLLEVALCVMLYTAVLWIELAPAFLERMRDASHRPFLSAFAHRVTPPLQRALPAIIALGVLLPTMHQSSLGALLLLAGAKVHPLWQTPFLPLLFLLSAVAMGYAAVVIEATTASIVFGRPLEIRLLRDLRRPALVAVIGYLAIRLGDIVYRGRLRYVAALDEHSLIWLAEMGLVIGAVWLLRTAKPSPRRLLQAALLLATGGVLYRFSTFLFAYDPGHGWRYFPSVTEILVTVGVVAGEVAAYLYLVKRLPILSAAPEPKAVPTCA